MFDKDEKNINKEIDILHEKYLFSNKRLNGLKTELAEKDIELKKNTAQLKLYNRELLKSDKKIKDAQDEFFLIKNKFNEMGDSLNFIEQESRETEAELKDLTVKKHDLIENISKLEFSTQQIINAAADIEAENQKTLPAIERCEAEKSSLSEEMSGLLEKVHGDKEEGDAELNELSLRFAKRMNEYEQIKGILAEREKVLSGLKNEVTLLEQKCSLIEEVFELKAKRDLLKIDIEKMDQAAQKKSRMAKELKKVLSEKDEELNSLCHENDERNNSIASLEKEVGLYGELVSKAQNVENRLADSVVLIDQADSDLKKLFSDNIKLEQELFS